MKTLFDNTFAKCISAFILMFLTASSLISAEAADIPTGQDSPEGVACDAIQAYINCDSQAWLKTLIRPIYGEEKNKEYEAFKKQMVELTDSNKTNSSFTPPKIVKCYKARPFTKNGPGSLAYAMHEMTANGFVDVEIAFPDGQTTNLRYHVMYDKDKKWYFEPRPDLCPMLSMGLNTEEPSTEVWTKPAKQKEEPKAEETKQNTNSGN